MTIQQNLEKNWTNHRNECTISSPSLKFFMNIIHYNSAKEIVKYFPNIKACRQKVCRSSSFKYKYISARYKKMVIFKSTIKSTISIFIHYHKSGTRANSSALFPYPEISESAINIQEPI